MQNTYGGFLKMQLRKQKSLCKSSLIHCFSGALSSGPDYSIPGRRLACELILLQFWQKTKLNCTSVVI